MATKKSLKKKMARMIAAMPVINRLTHEEHFVKGNELIEQGHTENPDGSKIQADKTYRQMMPVVIQRNHESGIQKAFARGGREGVTNYLKRMRNIVEQNL